MCTCRANVSWRGISSVPAGGSGISLERRKRCGVFIATATTTDGRLGSRACLTSSLVTVTVQSLLDSERERERERGDSIVCTADSYLVTQLCGTLLTSQVDRSCI